MGRLLDPDPSPSRTRTCDLSEGHHTIWDPSPKHSWTRHPSGSCAGDRYTSVGSSRNCHLSFGRYGDRVLSPGFPSPIPDPVTFPEAASRPGTRRPGVPGPVIPPEGVCCPETHRPVVLGPVTCPGAVCWKRTLHLAAPGPVTRPEAVTLSGIRHPSGSRAGDHYMLVGRSR